MAKKILVIEDEKPIARLIEVNLQRFGYEVVISSNEFEALEKLERDKPNLVILDILRNPILGRGSFEMLRILKSNSSLPVIMLLSREEFRDNQPDSSEFPDLFLPKPFNPLELISLVNQRVSS